MKITTKELRKIIKEELAEVFEKDEGKWSGAGWYTFDGGKIYSGPHETEQKAEDSLPNYLSDLEIKELKEKPAEEK